MESFSTKLPRRLITLTWFRWYVTFYAGFIARPPKMGVEPCPYFHWWRLRVVPLHPSYITNQNHTPSNPQLPAGLKGTVGWVSRSSVRGLQECVTHTGVKTVRPHQSIWLQGWQIIKYSSSGSMVALLKRIKYYYYLKYISYKGK